MDGQRLFDLSNYKKKFFVTKKISEETALCEEIYNYFGKPKNFYSLVRKMIDEKGKIFVRETFNEIKKGENIKDRKTLFLYKILNQKIT